MLVVELTSFVVLVTDALSAASTAVVVVTLLASAWAEVLAVVVRRVVERSAGLEPCGDAVVPNAVSVVDEVSEAVMSMAVVLVVNLVASAVFVLVSSVWMTALWVVDVGIAEDSALGVELIPP